MAGKLLPDFVGQLEPYWADFNISGGSEFGDYLAKHGDEVAGALLSVTDAKAASSDRPTVTRAYCRSVAVPPSTFRPRSRASATWC